MTIEYDTYVDEVRALTAQKWRDEYSEPDD
jgi:hypothetical protein